MVSDMLVAVDKGRLLHVYAPVLMYAGSYSWSATGWPTAPGWTRTTQTYPRFPGEPVAGSYSLFVLLLHA